MNAGYSPRSARVTASHLLTKANILERLRELQQEAASDKILSILQRKQILTEIIRARRNASEIIKAIHELNRMEGIYK